jgi:orotate phosphoribosyltransferase
MSERDDLRKLIHDRVVVWGRVTRSSAAEADSIVDLRRLSEHHAGVASLGRVTSDLGDGKGSAAVGRSTLGIDPVTATLHEARQRGRALDAFVVRKEGKAHGPQRRIHRLDEAGRRAAAVEDASTIGGSALSAVDAPRRVGMDVAETTAVVDRSAGAAVRAAGLEFRSACSLAGPGRPA